MICKGMRGSDVVLFEEELLSGKEKFKETQGEKKMML